MAPQVRAEIDAKIAQLRELGTRYHPFEITSRVAAMHLFSFDSDETNTEGVKSESQVEYLLSLFLAQSFPPAPEFPPGLVVEQCLKLLDELHQQVTLYYSIFADSRTADYVEEQLQVSLRINHLHVRGDSYYVHARQTFLELAARHDDFLQRRCGFSHLEFLGAIDEAERVLLESTNRHMASMFSIYGELSERYGDERPSDGPEEEEFRERTSEFAQALQGIGGMALFEIKPRPAIDALVFRHLAMAPGDNASFLTAIPKWPAWPLNPSKVAERPLVLHDGRYYLFHPQILARNILPLLERIIMETDDAYWRSTFLVHRDLHAEKTTLALVRNTLPGCRAVSNAFYWFLENGERKWAEADALVIYDDTLLIMEMKAGTLAEAARRGGMKSMRSSVEETIEKAYRQASRTNDYVRSAHEVIFYDSGQQEVLRLRHASFERIFLIGVVSDQYSSLCTQLPLLRKLGFLRGTDWPWIVTLNDLRVVTELCSHPTMLLFYLLRRIAVNGYPQIYASDELEFFAHFMQQGLYFEDNADVKKASLYAISGMSAPLDAYYRARELGMKNPSPPVVKMPAVLLRFIQRLESARPRHFVSAALHILQFGADARDRLAGALPSAEEYYRENGLARWVVFRDDPPSPLGLLLACAPVDSPKVSQSVIKACALKDQQRIRNAVLVLWQPPFETGSFAIQFI